MPTRIKDELLAERHKLHLLLVQTSHRIALLDGMLAEDEGEINWSDSAERAVILAGEPLTTPEILEAIFVGRKEELLLPEKRRKYILQLSMTLARLCQKKILFGLAIKGYKGKIYGNGRWCAADSYIKPEHQDKVESKIQMLMRDVDRRSTNYGWLT